MRPNLAGAGIKSREPSTRNPASDLYATRFCVRRQTFIEWNAAEMRRIYANDRSMAKSIARDAAVSVRTAEGYLAERHPPGGLALTHLLANNAEYARAHRQMLDGGTEYPDLERIVTGIVNRLVKR